MTVVGGNITIPCDLPVNSESWPIWQFRPAYSTDPSSDYINIHNGHPDMSPRPTTHFAVDVIDNFSHLTLMNASGYYAGTYRCEMRGNRSIKSEIELVVIGECFVLLQSCSTACRKDL